MVDCELRQTFSTAQWLDEAKLCGKDPIDELTTMAKKGPSSRTVESRP